MADDELEIIRTAVNQGITSPAQVLRRLQKYFEYDPDWKQPTLEQVKAAIDMIK